MSGYSAVPYERESWQSIKKTKKYIFVKHVISFHSLLWKVIFTLVRWDVFFTNFLIQWKIMAHHIQICITTCIHTTKWCIHCSSGYIPWRMSKTRFSNHPRVSLFSCKMERLYHHDPVPTVLFSKGIKAGNTWHYMLCLVTQIFTYLFLIYFTTFSKMWLHDIRWFSRIIGQQWCGRKQLWPNFRH